MAKEIFESTGKALLFLTIAVIAALVVGGILIYKFRNDKFDTFKKSALGIVVGFSVAVAVAMTFLKFQTNFYDPDLEHNLIDKYLVTPIMSIVLVAVVGGLLMYVSTLFSKKLVKAFGIATLLGELGAFITTMVLMMKYFQQTETIVYYPSLNTVGLISSGVVFIAVVALIFMLGKSHKADNNNTKALVYGAISVAMSFALSYIIMYRQPQGGSLTFASLLPLMIYCCMFGTRRGVIVCLLYGVLQAIQDPWIIHPMQFLLDYPLAFGMIAVSGIFMERGMFKKHKVVAFILGAILAVLLRYACHICSGVFAFADTLGSGGWVGKYGSIVAGSFAYNSFALIDMSISIVAGTALFASKAFTRQLAATGSISLVSVGEYEANTDINPDDDDFQAEIFTKNDGDDDFQAQIYTTGDDFQAEIFTTNIDDDDFQAQILAGEASPNDDIDTEIFVTPASKNDDRASENLHK